MKMSDSVSVVIPTLNAEPEIEDLLALLEAQTFAPREIIVIDSSSDDHTVEIAKAHPLVRVIEIQRKDFDHGGTRNLGFNESVGDFVLFMTQDAVPVDESLLEKLLRPFEDGDVAIVSARQLPKEDARPFERLVREFNYPDESNKRSEKDIKRLGIKAFFSSDVCCMYRRSSLSLIGGVPTPCSTNEDMLAAARCLKADMSVCYVADACVYHSHNLSINRQFQRNKEIGMFLSRHDNELGVSSESSEGKKLVEFVVRGLWDERNVVEILAFTFDCLARLLGNKVGRRLGAK